MSVTARITWARSAVPGRARRVPLRLFAAPTLALPLQGCGSRLFIDVAAPGHSAHHPGITRGGVMCGDRDNSSIGRNLRGWPRPACEHLDPQGGSGAPGSSRRHYQLGRRALLLWKGRPSFSARRVSQRREFKPQHARASDGHPSNQQRRAPEVSCGSIPRHYRAARSAVSRDQNCAGSPPVLSQHSQATCASRHRGSLLEQAGLAEAGGSHHQRQRLKRSEQDDAPHPGPSGAGTATSRRWDRHASSVR